MEAAEPVGRRSEQRLGQRADVVVVGGGVVGVAAAWELAMRGVPVTLVDKGAIAAGCSYGNAGYICPSHSVPLPHPGVLSQGLRFMFDATSPFYVRPRLDRELARWLWRFRSACTERHVRHALPVIRDLSQASLDIFTELAGKFDFGFRRDGLLTVYRTERAFHAGCREADALQRAGIAVKILHPEAVHTLEPSLRPDVIGAVYFPDDAHATPDRFVRGLAQLAEDAGVTLSTETEVLGFRTDGARVVAVETTRGDIACRELVLAAGSWSPTIARWLGLRVPVQAAKGYSLTYEAPENGPRRPVLCAEARVAVTPMRGDHGPIVRFGGTLELAGLDMSINRPRVAAIERGARQFLALPDELSLVEMWRGLRPCTPDGLPMIGRPRRWKNLVLATGHAMLGFTLGPVTGQLVAQVVTGETPRLDLRPVDPDRFAS